MNKLVIGNILYRPVRSAISVLAVAIEVIMILCIVAIMVGQVQGAASQTGGVGADIIVRPPNASFLSAVGGAPVPAKVAGVLAKLPHVAVASPVIANLSMGNALQTIWGIDFESYNALRPFQFVEGGPFHGPNDVIVDDLYAKSNHAVVGQTIELLHHSFHVSGIVEHGKGGRIFVPIGTLGTLLGTPNNASLFYVRWDSPNNQKAIAEEIHATPGLQNYEVQPMADYMAMMTPEHFPGFNIALRVVIGIAVIVGFLVIFQSMYTAVMERTREIGILKSLGASKTTIVNLVLREAGLVAVAGIIVGMLATWGIRWFMSIQFPTLPFYLSDSWLAYGTGIALIGSVLGALYPAWKAASKDPIDALAYE
ncbi:MAG TPA: FtsX-like permease family protein [Acidobacteriaceae bacterium]|jgi:putative ABC transport system permease protein|nr:FtsX-like permease family protein [Acidobacteriaceae bacterium]